ncbi:VOC family protein [Rhodobacteraceae bacterium HSP-20]|uniref:VOC family protein n=1 Tax=Paragemmobacter amnigenus TaxID=2852097 RepID=A0ABS6IZX9_9RHOB|nr:VOC family protein [Rhodobacter amnigenus]MBU9696903.1 VOC family protein [Rhodobacter amnigenus]MBV4388130.1 VOC family protein [Rhodobacter amnigenus]
MLVLDHLAVSCTGLAEGVAAVEAALGLPLAAGGQHPHMATHNRLLSLGPDLYLEVIAADPSQPRPAWPRWFDLDRFSGPPRLTNWICRTGDLDAELAQSPAGTGTPVALQRGDFRWRMAVPASGILPFDNRFPALIQWEGTAHPAPRLPDHGARLTALHITHPQPDALRAALSRLSDPRVHVTAGPPALRATITTPQGERVLT